MPRGLKALLFHGLLFCVHLAFWLFVFLTCTEVRGQELLYGASMCALAPTVVVAAMLYASGS